MFRVHFINEPREPEWVSFVCIPTLSDLDNLLLLWRAIDEQAHCTVMYLLTQGPDNQWKRLERVTPGISVGVIIHKEVEVWLRLRGFAPEVVSKLENIKTLAQLKTLNYSALRKRFEDINTIINILRETAAL